MAGNLFYFLLVCLPVAIFVAGIVSLILWRKNLVLIIIALEICFVSAHVGFVISSILLDDAAGLIFSIIGLTLAGAEVSLGLAIAIIVYRRFDSVYSKNLKFLKS